ncbi:MAG: hypothetical protein ACK5O2_14745 [Microthrixaceae bacterium]
MVQFRLCDVSSASARTWIAYATSVLLEVRDDPHLAVDSDALDMLQAHLDQWDVLARVGDSLTVHAEIPSDELEYLGHLFCRLSNHMTKQADERGYDVSPPGGDEFFAALSEAVIVALEQSGEQSSTEFAGGLRSQWPRTDRLMPDGSLVAVSPRPLAGNSN